MNSHVQDSIVMMKPDELRELVSEVKETVATGISTRGRNKKHIFSAADLWRIQKKMRTAPRVSNKREISA